MEFILSLVIKSMGQVWLSIQHNWPYLALSVVIATLLKLYINAEKVSDLLNRFRRAGIIVATAAAVATPLCSCGTIAVILGMLASRMPWAPIVAFMVASPLSSPEGLVYSAGLFGWPFALVFYLVSIVLGLAGGGVAVVLESHGWLANQARYAEPAPVPPVRPAYNPASVASSRIFNLESSTMQLSAVGTTCGCAGEVALALPASCVCSQVQPIYESDVHRSDCACSSSSPVQTNSKDKVTLPIFLKELYSSSKRLLVMFLGFAFVGYFLNGLIPASWVAALFGGGHVYNIPLAATLGLPFYINSEASLPLISALLEAGMSPGAALAFLISGAGTSVGAITGALTIARWRVVGLVVAVLWVGAILSGFAFNLGLRLDLF